MGLRENRSGATLSIARVQQPRPLSRGPRALCAKPSPMAWAATTRPAPCRTRWKSAPRWRKRQRAGGAGSRAFASSRRGAGQLVRSRIRVFSRLPRATLLWWNAARHERAYIQRPRTRVRTPPPPRPPRRRRSCNTSTSCRTNRSTRQRRTPSSPNWKRPRTGRGTSTPGTATNSNFIRSFSPRRSVPSARRAGGSPRSATTTSTATISGSLRSTRRSSSSNPSTARRPAGTRKARSAAPIGS